MNRFYIIVPVVLLVLFGAVYWQHSKGAEQKAEAMRAAAAKAKADEDAKHAAAEKKAKEDADRRSEERRKEEEAKEAARKAKYDADTQKLKADVAQNNTDADNLNKQAAKLEAELTNLRAAKEKANHDAFELTKQVELAKIDKRNAELEVQRMTEMVARRAADSSMARPPMVAAAPKQ
jgi:hypothetical protein